MKVKSEDAMADFILKEAATKDSCRKIVIESAFEFYMGRNIFRSITFLLLIGILFYIYVNGDLPIWGVLSIAIALMAFMETKRNCVRIDSILKLSELNRDKSDTSRNLGSSKPISKN